MSSSGQLVTTREDHRACRVTALFSYGLVSTGCDFEGVVEIIDDPETLTSYWACPVCREDHTGGIGE